MARSAWSRVDVYLNDRMEWTGAAVRLVAGTLTVRARPEAGRPMVAVATMTDAEVVEAARNGRERRTHITATDEGGNPVTVVLFGRGCACGG